MSGACLIINCSLFIVFIINVETRECLGKSCRVKFVVFNLELSSAVELAGIDTGARVSVVAAYIGCSEPQKQFCFGFDLNWGIGVDGILRVMILMLVGVC